MCVGRASATDSLFDPTIATFDDDGGAYNQADAAGFIKLNALRLRIGANVKAKRAGATRAAKPAAEPAAKPAVNLLPSQLPNPQPRRSQPSLSRQEGRTVKPC